GRPVVVDNKPGADQIIGTLALTNAEADGHTLMLTGDTMMIHKAYGRDLPYDPSGDITPVSRVSKVSMALLANPKLKANTVGELIELAGTKPGGLAAGHLGHGGTHYLAIKLLEKYGNIRFLDVPYRGSGPSISAVVGGEIDIDFGGVGTGLSLAEANKVKIVGDTGDGRAPCAPNNPSIAESGLHGYEIETSFYIYAQGRPPVSTISVLDEAIHSVLSAESLQAPLSTMGL